MGVICSHCGANNTQDSEFCKKCGTHILESKNEPIPTKTLEVPKEELSTGSTFAQRYQIIEELGKGGMGMVYKAYDTEVKDRIALKLIKPDISLDKNTIERFQNELKLARKITHRNVCRMHDLGKSDSNYFITMEYVPGENLKGMIRMMGQLRTGKAISIARQVCEGLSEAHRIGVVHRDLKPSNIMIDTDGNAKIMDFGIARSLRSKGITGVGVMIGTAEYMSPEQVESKEVDQRSDIYALGVILYEMVTGRVPFEGDTAYSIGVKHKSEAPTDPKEINPQIPDDLNRLILKCLEKKKEQRYQSAAELQSELDNIGKGMPATEVTGPTEKPMTSKEITVTFRRRWLWAPVLFVGVILIVTAIFFLRREKPVTPAREQKMLVVLPFENLGNPDDDYFANGMTEEITSRLSVLHGLGVISRSSAIQYKQTDKTIKQIGEELDVDYVLEGTVRWDRSPEGKGRVRVTPQLIRVSDDTHLWSERYDRVVEDIFGVQSDIAEQVIKQLDLTVLEPERQALYVRPTDNLEAYDLLMRSLEQESKTDITGDMQDNEKAIQLIEEAIQLDPNCALAFVWLSHCHRLAYFFYAYDQTEERLEKWKNAIDKALELQPDMPEAHDALAWYYYQGLLDYDRSLEELEYVQKVRPNTSPFLLASIQRRQGDWEQSTINLEKSFKLNPRSAWIADQICGSYIDLRMYDKAEFWCNRALSINPDHLNALLQKFLIIIYSKGDTGKARAYLGTMPKNKEFEICWFDLCMREQKYQEAVDRIKSLSFESEESQNYYFHKDLALASVYHAQKDYSLMKAHADLVRTVLEKQVKEHPQDPRYHSALGIVYAYLGLKDEAIREAELAMELCPITKDALAGQIYLFELTKIYALVGNFDEAVGQLEKLLSMPCGALVSVSSLRLEREWDPMRDHPGFQQLLEKYSENKE